MIASSRDPACGFAHAGPLCIIGSVYARPSIYPVTSPCRCFGDVCVRSSDQNRSEIWESTRLTSVAV